MRFNTVIVLIFSVGIVHSGIPPNFEELVSDLINNFVLPRNNQPGIGITVVTTDGSYNLTRGYGLKNVAKNSSIDDSTLFLIGSVSKSFTATLVAKILNEKFPQYGEAVLDIPVAKLWPSFNFTLIDRARAESTSFRDLLSHRTCLARDDIGVSFEAIKSIEEFAYRSRYIPEGCPFRSGLSYNNNLLALAGELIAQLNGNSNYTELLEIFLKDLGMNSTTVVRENDDYEKWDQLATPYYRKEGDLVTYDFRSINRAQVAGAAGYVISSMTDMSKYARFHLNLGKVDGRQIVPESVLTWLYRPSILFDSFEYKSQDFDVNGNFAYGLGLFIGFFEGTRYVHHGGYWPPYASEFSLFPDLNIGVFTSSSGPGSLIEIPNESLHWAIAKLVQGESSYEEIKQELLNKPKNKRNSVEQFTLKSETCSNCIKADVSKLPGIYGNPSQGEIKISLNESDPKGNLYFQHGAYGKAYIRVKPTLELLLEWDSEVVIADSLAGGSEEVPDIYLYFVDEDNFYYSSPLFMYTRNLTFETLPEIPWAPGSCTGV